MDLADFILPEDHELVHQWIDTTKSGSYARVAKSWSQMGSKCKDRDGGGGYVYEVDHYEVYAAQAFDWPPSDRNWSTFGNLQDSVVHHCERVQECVLFHEMQVTKRSAEFHDQAGARKPLLWDNNMSIKWQMPLRPSICPGILCSSRHWVANQRRDALGIEMLGLQGLPWNVLQPLRELEQIKQIHLAGNAMNCFVLVPFLISWLGVLDVNHMLSRRESLVALRSAASVPGATNATVATTSTVPADCQWNEEQENHEAAEEEEDDDEENVVLVEDSEGGLEFWNDAEGDMEFWS